MKKISIILFLAAFSCNFSLAQVNLVPNPSFEDTIHCVTGVYQFQGYVSNWLGSIVEYFSQKCQGSGVEVPRNPFGFQRPRTGIAFCGIYTLEIDSTGTTPNHPNWREYIQVKLSDSLIANKKYFVSFYVNLANFPQYACNDMGAYFNKTPLTLNASLIRVTPQIQNDPINNPLIDTLNWTEIKGAFIAGGGEKYITIGNFKSDSMSHYTYLHAPIDTTYGWKNSFYHIEDVLVAIDTVGNLGVNNLPEETIFFKVYPNPNDGIMFIDYDLNNHKDARLKLFTIYGELVSEYYLDSNKDRLTVDDPSLKNGIYFYSVVSHNSILSKGKLIISR